MKEVCEFVNSFDNNPLFVRFNIPDTFQDEAKGIIIFNHGYADHSGRFVHTAKALCDKNFIVVTFDMRGNGKSGPSLGHCESLQDFLLDNIYIMNYAEEKMKKPILGLMGHSFGGVTMTYTAALLGKKCPPVFLSSPCYNFKQKPSFLILIIAKIISKIYPRLYLPAGVITDFLSNNPDNNNSHKKDPLVFKTVTIQHVLFMLYSVFNLKNIINKVKTKITVFAGEQDNLCSTTVTQNICEQYINGICQFNIIKNAGHEIFNEQGDLQTTALNALQAWTEELTRIPQAN